MYSVDGVAGWQWRGTVGPTATLVSGEEFEAPARKSVNYATRNKEERNAVTLGLSVSLVR